MDPKEYLNEVVGYHWILKDGWLQATILGDILEKKLKLVGIEYKVIEFRIGKLIMVDPNHIIQIIRNDKLNKLLK